MAGNLLGKLLARRPFSFSGQGAGAEPEAGQIYGFATAPLSEFAVGTTGRHAAFKIIGVSKDYVAIVVLDGVWPEMPTVEKAKRACLLREHRFQFKGAPAVLGVLRESWVASTLKDMKLLGTAAMTPEDNALAAAIRDGQPGSRFGTLVSANYSAEGEWRWTHDRAAFKTETAQVRAREDARQAAREARYRDRLKALTWDKLFSEAPFPRWTGVSPYPPEGFTAEARRIIREACEDLKALGDKPRKAEVRVVLKRCVEWFNAADERAGGVIETEEREDICDVLEEIAFVAKQPSLVDEIDEWRTW